MKRPLNLFFIVCFVFLSGLVFAQRAAPDFMPSGEWFNSDALSIADLQGQVVLIDMWTFGCYNCYRSIPTLSGFYETYHDAGFEIVGVHRPEFEFEKDADNLKDAIAEHEVIWPVFQDNDAKTWRAYGARAWPTYFLIDKKGVIRYSHRGEISENFPAGIAPLEAAINELLEEN